MIDDEPKLAMAVFPGTEVMVKSVNHRGATREIVAKVGRKNFYLKGWRDRPFDLFTGRIKDDYGHHTAYTLEGWEWKRRVDIARKLLMDQGITLGRSIDDRKVVAICDAIHKAGIFP